MNKALAALILLFCCFGFRSLTSARWRLTPEHHTIWVDLTPELVSKSFNKTEFHDGADPLAALPQDHQVSYMMNQVLADYNAVQTTLVHLQAVPGEWNVAAPASPADLAYDATYAATHTIHVQLAAPGALGAAGDAGPSINGSDITDCRVRIASSDFVSAEEFRITLEHEFMHCMGFAHLHEDPESIMSYGVENTYHLAEEEKMALTYGYPLDASYGRETPTLGLACTPGK